MANDHPPLPPLPVARPVAKEPTISKAPPQGRKFPCPQCGARLDFDPSSRGLKCPFCGYSSQIERDDKAEIVERDFQEYLAREESKGKVIPGQSNQVRCPGCGAIILIEDKLATDRCPFCSTHLENEPKVAAMMIPPEGVMPFRVELRAARDEFTKWLHGLWFAPNELKKVAALGQLTGVYLPYWTYDAMTVTFYDGQRGDAYTETEYVTVRKPDGSTETVTQNVVRIRWTPISGEVRHFFDDVLVPATHTLPADLIHDLGDWNLNKLEPFDPAYLSGFKTERYVVGLKEGLSTAKEMMKPTIHMLIRQDIGGDQQQIGETRTRYSAMTFKHVLLPVWVAVYRYNHKTYQVMVNGRSGKVTGYRPWSVWKIAGLAMAITIAIMTVIVLVMMMKK